MNDYKNVFIFSFSLLIYLNSNNQRVSLLIYVNSKNQRVILNVLLVRTWQSARIINYRNPQASFYTPCISECIAKSIYGKRKVRFAVFSSVYIFNGKKSFSVSIYKPKRDIFLCRFSDSASIMTLLNKYCEDKI